MIKMDNFKTVILFVVASIIVLFVFITTNLFKDDRSAKFEKATKEKIEEIDVTNNPTDSNKYSLKSINREEMAIIYYNDFKNMIINFPDEAYQLIINNEDISEEEFNSYRDELLFDIYDYNYQKYSYYQDSSTNNYVYRVVNTKGETFTFHTNGVMRYAVNITL